MTDIFGCAGTQAAAPAAGAAAGTAAGGGILSWLPLIVIFVVFILLIIVPQKKRDKKVKEMLSAIKPGDRIKTIGGFYGRVLSVKEDLIVMECGPDKAKLQIARGAVAAVESSDVENELTDKPLETK